MRAKTLIRKFAECFRKNAGARMINWNDLRHFLAIAQEGSLGAAARSLKVNQSTTQRRLLALEKALDAYSWNVTGLATGDLAGSDSDCQRHKRRRWRSMRYDAKWLRLTRKTSAP